MLKVSFAIMPLWFILLSINHAVLPNLGHLHEEYEQSPLFIAPNTIDNNTEWFSLIPGNSTQEPFTPDSVTTINNGDQYNDSHEVSPLQ